jgi:hypothetical protein
MKSTLVSCLLLASAVFGSAQTAAPGVASEWDIQKLLEALSLQAQHLKPVIEQVRPEAWVSQGASETYVAQWKAAQAELRYLLASSTAFSRQPERLSLGLDTYFRMQAMDSTLGSLIEGVRKYQSPDLADLMQSVVNENSTNRDRLRQYLQDLAVQKEHEFQVADREAQRCRTTLLQPAAPKGRKATQP